MKIKLIPDSLDGRFTRKQSVMDTFTPAPYRSDWRGNGRSSNFARMRQQSSAVSDHPHEDVRILQNWTTITCLCVTVVIKKANLTYRSNNRWSVSPRARPEFTLGRVSAVNIILVKLHTNPYSPWFAPGNNRPNHQSSTRVYDKHGEGFHNKPKAFLTFLARLFFFLTWTTTETRMNSRRAQGS